MRRHRESEAAILAVSEGIVMPLPLDPNDPLAVARRFLADRYDQNGVRLLHAWRDELRTYLNNHYPVVSRASARSEIYLYLEKSVRLTTSATLEPIKPTAALVNNVLDALHAAAFLDVPVAPCWLDGPNDRPANEIVACQNGLLHLPTRELLPHSPTFLTTHALPFAFSKAAEPPTEWLRFLDTLWEDDRAASATLQEIFGYIVSGERKLQKAFMIVGPPRAGKDTIARVLRRLLGEEHCAGPTLSSLSGPFGLQSLIDKPLAVIADARLSGRSDQAVIAERLLAITGEGFLTVDRKFQPSWSGQLPTRFLILTNELPRFEDASGALSSRFVLLQLSRSWYGKEDTTLFSRLERELPLILNWALDGLDRLEREGRFSVPASSASALRELEDLASPIKAFVRERCVLNTQAWIECGQLYGEWRRWNEGHGRNHPPPANLFSRDLRAAFPSIATTQPRVAGARERRYQGIGIRS